MRFEIVAKTGCVFVALEHKGEPELQLLKTQMNNSRYHSLIIKRAVVGISSSLAFLHTSVGSYHLEKQERYI